MRRRVRRDFTLRDLSSRLFRFIGRREGAYFVIRLIISMFFLFNRGCTALLLKNEVRAFGAAFVGAVLKVHRLHRFTQILIFIFIIYYL
jgi:hypothetical protein